MLGNRGFPEARSRLCVCRAAFHMTFAMGGVPYAGSRQVVINHLNKVRIYIGLLYKVRMKVKALVI